MSSEIITEEITKYLRSHVLGTEYKDSKEFALDLLLKLASLKAQLAIRANSNEVATHVEGGLGTIIHTVGGAEVARTEVG